MTVILELPPESEANLRERAAKYGQSVTDYLLTLAEWEPDLDLSLSAEEVEIVKEGIADFDAGDRGVSLEEFDEHMRATLARIKHEKAAFQQ